MKKLQNATRALLGCCTFLTLAATGFAQQWVFTDLNPPGNVRSEAIGVFAGRQVGFADGQRVQWTGTPDSATVVGPYHGELILGVGADGTWAGVSGTEGAGVFIGTADWYPFDVDEEDEITWGVTGADNGRQLGWKSWFYGHYGAAYDFGYWEGTRESWHTVTQITPPGYGSLTGIDGDRFCGTFTYPIGEEQVWVTRAKRFGGPGGGGSLHPEGAFASSAWKIHGDQQLGSVQLEEGGPTYTALWNNTPESWVDFNPPGNQGNGLSTLHQGRQGGSHSDGVSYRAAIWAGSPELRTDLPQPEGALSSQVTAINDDGERTTAVGIVRYPDDVVHAALWTHINTTFNPSSFSLFRGSVVSGNLASLFSSDDNRLVLRPGAVFSTAEHPIQVILEGTSPEASPPVFSFLLESHASIGNAVQKISFYNFDTSEYELMDSRPAWTSDVEVRVNVVSNASRFIEAGTLKVKTRISYKALGPTFIYPWHARLDRARWVLPY